MISKIEYAQNYKSKVTDMAGYEKILNSSLYADEDNFGRLNAKKYAKDIKKLADMDVTPRGDRGPYDWCLYFQNGRCGACIKRCPVDAISKDGHDKQRCFDYEDESVAKYWPSHIDKKNYIFGCGICQSKVPCRDRRP